MSLGNCKNSIETQTKQMTNKPMNKENYNGFQSQKGYKMQNVCVLVCLVSFAWSGKSRCWRIQTKTKITVFKKFQYSSRFSTVK